MPRLSLFLNYRRDTGLPWASRLFSDLEREFGRQVFMDHEAIQAGDVWPARLAQAVDDCSALVAVIDPEWNGFERAGQRALDDARDWVKAEIARALERGVLVVPVLVGEHDPASTWTTNLPEPIAPLALRQAVTLRDRSWPADLARLLAVLRLCIQPAPVHVDLWTEAREASRDVLHRASAMCVGRDAALIWIDEQLQAPGPTTLVVTGPGGIGKTAVLARWITTAMSREGWCVVAHCFSERAGLTSTREALVSVVQQIEEHRGLPPTRFAPDAQEGTVRAHLRHQIASWPSPGPRLIVALDALDVADTQMHPILGHQAPENVAVLASIRHEGVEPPRALRQWPAFRRLHLQALGHGGVEAWLRELHLTHLADDRKFVASVVRTTEGLPLYLRFLLDDLVQDGVHDVSRQPRGFPDYVEAELRVLADDQSAIRDKVQRLFALLVASVAPVPEPIVQQLSGLSSIDLRGIPRRFERWFSVTRGSDRDPLYAFTHPVVGEQFKRVMRREAQDAEASLLAYGRSWPAHRNRFALTTLAEQLRAAHHDAELFELARDPAFAAAQLALRDGESVRLATLRTALACAIDARDWVAAADMMLRAGTAVSQQVASQFPSELARAGDLERALTRADLEAPVMRMLWYLLIASERFRAGDVAQARSIATRVLEMKVDPMNGAEGDAAAALLLGLFDADQDLCLQLVDHLLVYRTDHPRRALAEALIARGAIGQAARVVPPDRAGDVAAALAVYRIRTAGRGEIDAAKAFLLNNLPAKDAPYAAGWILQLAFVAIDIGCADEARELFTAALKHAEEHRHLDFFLDRIAVGQWKAGFHEDAERTLQLARSENHEPGIRIQWALHELAAGREPGNALELTSDRIAALARAGHGSSLGGLCEALGRHDDAAGAFRAAAIRALQQRRQPYPWPRVAETFRPDEASEEYRSALASAKVWGRLRVGDLAGARDAFQQVSVRELFLADQLIDAHLKAGQLANALAIVPPDALAWAPQASDLRLGYSTTVVLDAACRGQTTVAFELLESGLKAASQLARPTSRDKRLERVVDLALELCRRGQVDITRRLADRVADTRSPKQRELHGLLALHDPGDGLTPERLAELTASHGDVLRIDLAAAWLRLGDPAAAQRLAGSPYQRDAPAFWSRLTRIALERGEIATARSFTERLAQASDPGFWLIAGKDETAFETRHAERAVEALVVAHLQSGEVGALLAWLMQLRGDLSIVGFERLGYEDPGPAFEQALEHVSGGEKPQAARLMALCLGRLVRGDPQTGRRALDRALALPIADIGWTTAIDMFAALSALDAPEDADRYLAAAVAEPTGGGTRVGSTAGRAFQRLISLGHRRSREAWEALPHSVQRWEAVRLLQRPAPEGIDDALEYVLEAAQQPGDDVVTWLRTASNALLETDQRAAWYRLLPLGGLNLGCAELMCSELALAEPSCAEAIADLLLRPIEAAAPPSPR